MLTIPHDRTLGTIASGVYFVTVRAPFPLLPIDVLKIMKGAVLSWYIFCVPSLASVFQVLGMRLNYCWPSYKSHMASATVSLFLWMGQRSVLNLCGRTAGRPQAPVSSHSHA